MKLLRLVIAIHRCRFEILPASRWLEAGGEWNGEGDGDGEGEGEGEWKVSISQEKRVKLAVTRDHLSPSMASGCSFNATDQKTTLFPHPVSLG